MVEKKILELKAKIKKKKPAFRRTEEYRHAKLKDTWRRPTGKQSKQRQHEKSRGNIPKPGYGTPATLRGCNRQGFLEVLVSNEKEIAAIDPKNQVAIVASSVGAKKKEKIALKAKELKIKLGNVKRLADDV